MEATYSRLAHSKHSLLRLTPGAGKPLTYCKQNYECLPLNPHPWPVSYKQGETEGTGKFVKRWVLRDKHSQYIHTKGLQAQALISDKQGVILPAIALLVEEGKLTESKH